jgi:microcystin degradation protein MlrC
MKVFTAGLATETNTFSPMLTGREAFIERAYYPPGQHPDAPTMTAAPLWALRRRARTEGWRTVEGLVTSAQPAGLVARAVYEEFRDDILEQLRVALPVDFVALGLHGAMVADGYDDCEGDLLTRVRGVVGPNVPVGAELDPHCHMTQAMVRAADVLICYKEFPHTDFLERGEDLVQILADTARGKVKPVMSLFDCRMINSFPTSRQPMRGLVDKIMAMEGKYGVLSISPVHCFPYADVPELGAKMLVVTDNRKAEGDALAERLGHELIAMREVSRPEFLGIDQAIDKALAAPSGPVVIAEPADNAGGGAPSDSTFFLRRLLDRGIGNSAIGPVWDPVAVQLCHDVGEGGRFALRFGGKMGVDSGDPIDAEVRVLKIASGVEQTSGNARFRLGNVAGIEVDGVAVVLNSIRQQAWGRDLFTQAGIDPTKRKLVVVKSTNHFYADFSKIAKEVLYSDGPGAIPRDFRKVPYTRISRPIWPLDPNPWGPAA